MCKRFSWLIVLLLIAFPAQGAPALHLGNIALNPRCKPCQDFDRYVNADWKRKHPIAENAESWDQFEELTKQNDLHLRSLLIQSAGHRGAIGSDTQKLGDFYASCMDTKRIESLTHRPLAAELERIALVRDRSTLIAELAHLQSYGLDVLFDFGTRDIGRTVNIKAEVRPTSLAMGEPFYYQQELGLFRAHVARIFAWTGSSNSATDAQVVANLESNLALASPPRRAQRLLQSRRLLKREQFQVLIPHLSLTAYFSALQLEIPSEFSVVHPAYFRALDRQLATVPIASWKVYLRWRLIDALAASLNRQIAQEDYRFNRQFWDDVSDEPRWKRCIGATDDALSGLLSQAFGAKYLSPTVRPEVQTILDNIRGQIKVSLTAQTWMSNETRERAFKRLDTLGAKIAFPEHSPDYSALKVERESFVANLFQAWQWETRRDLQRIGKLPDPDYWDTAVSEVNAYYDLGRNEIVLPAGILKPPFFSSRAEPAANYGGIGTVIGHELTHGLSALEQFDSQGNRHSWWNLADQKVFLRRSACLAHQFNQRKLDGQSSLPENVADLSGLTLSYAAFQKVQSGKPSLIIDGFSPEQRFFIYYARLWAANEPDYGYSRYAPSRLRVNLPLANMPGFALAFRCQLPKERCRIW
jgi:putative endopeptidase